MKKIKWFAILLSIAMVLTMFPVATSAAEGDVEYLYCDENGENWQTGTKADGEYTLVTSSDTSWSDGWYVVNSDVTNGNRIAVSGTVHLILADSCTLNATTRGIEIPSGQLTIYGQSAQTGALIAQALTQSSEAGIRVPTDSSLTINGGRITATGSAWDRAAGAGIGGNYAENSGSITINNGWITATGASASYGVAAGIGGGGRSASATSITITGDIIAEGGENGAAGIGGGHDGELKSCTITGGYIEATGHTPTLGGSANPKANPIGGGTNKSAANLADTNAVVIDHTAKTATFYGDTLNQDMTIPEGYTMTIANGQTLTIPEGKTLTNNGNVYVDGALNGSFSGTGNVYYHLTVVNASADGDLTEYNSKTYGKAGGEIALSYATAPIGQSFGEWISSPTVTVSDSNTFTMPVSALTLTAQIENAPTYTVTIPETVELGKSVTVVASGVNILYGAWLDVSLTGTSGDNNAFTLKTDKGATIEYSVADDNNNEYSVGDTVLTVGGGVKDNSGSKELKFIAPADEPKYSGEYTGTVIFTVSVKEEAQS